MPCNLCTVCIFQFPPHRTINQVVLCEGIITLIRLPSVCISTSVFAFLFLLGCLRVSLDVSDCLSVWMFGFLDGCSHSILASGRLQIYLCLLFTCNSCGSGSGNGSSRSCPCICKVVVTVKQVRKKEQRHRGCCGCCGCVVSRLWVACGGCSPVAAAACVPIWPCHEVPWLATSDLTIDLTLWVMVSNKEEAVKQIKTKEKSDAATEEQFNFFFSSNDWCALNWVK